MSRAIGVVAAQVNSVPYDPAATWERFEHHVRTLSIAFPAFDLYVFPELYLSGFGSWGDEYPLGFESRVAQAIPGPLTDRISELAQRVRKWIVPGSIYERDGTTIYNTSLAFSPTGELVCRYRKLFPWKPLENTTPGSDFGVFDIPGVGRFGMMICYDGWFPEVARALAWMGVEVILQPTATTTIDRSQELVLARANAIVNQCYIVNTNLGDLFGTGSSVIVDPEGVIVAQGGEGEAYLTHVIDVSRVETTRQMGTAGLNRMWKQLRDLPVPEFPQYVHGFRDGPIMRELGPLLVRSAVGDGRPTSQETSDVRHSA